MRGRRLNGVEFEFRTHCTVTPQPIIISATVTPIEGIPGGFTISIIDFETFSDEEPYFFWRTAEGTLLRSNREIQTVEFLADPGTGGRRIPILVGLGDGVGSVVRGTIWVEGRH